MDAQGETDQESQDVTVPIPVVTLTATGSKKKGRHIIDLAWTGSELVDIYRSFGGSLSLHVSGVSGASYTDQSNRKGKAIYVYQVCDVASSVCSDPVTLYF
jgi:hypothetical protein